MDEKEITGWVKREGQSMADTTFLAKLHPGSFSLLGRALVTKVHGIRVLRLLHEALIFSASLCDLLHPLVVFLLQTIGRTFGGPSGFLGCILPL